MLLSAVAWSVIGVLFTQQTYIIRHSLGVPARWLDLWIDGLPAIVYWIVITPVVMRLAGRLHAARARRPWLVAAIHLVVGSAVAYGDAFVNHLTGVEVRGVPAPIYLIFLRQYFWNLACYLVLVVLTAALEYARLYRERFEAAAALEAQLTAAKLQMLRSQLRPHFLFNTLNAIAEQVHVDSHRADVMIMRLASLLRASLAPASGTAVPLTEEFRLLGDYLDIMKARLGDRLTVTLSARDPQLATVAVPPMLLQPLVENAIRHGVEPVDRPVRVSVSAERDGDRLRLRVGDDGAGLPPAWREGIGLRNTRERLAHLYPGRATIAILPRLGGGTECVVTIPLELQNGSAAAESGAAA